MTRSEWIQRAALTFGADAAKALKHLVVLADEVEKVAPFDPEPYYGLADTLVNLSESIRELAKSRAV